MSLSAKKRSGKQTVVLANPPVIISEATVVGPLEGQGPLADYYDLCTEDSYFGENTWEKAERKYLLTSLKMALEKANLTPDDIHYLLAGDLLNQIISANFSARELQIPFFGLYGACSTMYESLSLGAMLLDGAFADYILTATSSHYSTAEKQFRFPTEQGIQKPLTSQRTVTGAAALVLAAAGNGPRITHITTGKVIDMGIKDSNDMGSAMAPAAVDTLVAHFQDTGRSPDYYDLIVTGDLAAVGKELTIILAGRQGLDLTKNYTDCGLLVYDASQNVYAGGSGCACSGVVTAGYLLKEMKQGRYKKILGIGTGALLSPLTAQQGDSIPCIAHAVAIEY